MTVWKGFEPSSRTKDIYNKAMAYVMQLCEQMDSELFNQFNGLKNIIWTKDRRDIPCENALGCAELGTGGSVYSMFFDNPQYDFFIQPMELVHKGMGEYYVEHGYPRPYDAANDIPHLAANAMAPPYAEWKTVGFKITSDWLLFRKATRVPIFMYNTKYLLEHTAELIAMIQAGTAPAGINGYWTTVPDSAAKKAVLEWLGHYHHGTEHH